MKIIREGEKRQIMIENNTFLFYAITSHLQQ